MKNLFSKILQFFKSLFVKPLPDVPTIPSVPSELMLPPAGTSPVPLAQLQDNARKYQHCTIKPEDLAELRRACDKIEKIETDTHLYSAVEAEEGIDRDAWAGMHYRECDCSLNGCLANGDPVVGPDAMKKGLTTTHVPKGLGPYPDFKSSAVDAISRELKDKGWKAAPVGIADMLGFTERYNGLGFRNHGIDSSYNWAGTTEEDVGGYDEDGHWVSTRVDNRVGVVAIMKELRRRELSEPPISSAPTAAYRPPASEAYASLRGLAKNFGVRREPVEELIAYHKKMLPTHNIRFWAVIDFSQSSREKRLYLLDTAEMKVARHLVAHGAGSDPNNDGIPTKFSDVDGSHMSSLGIVRCSELYRSRGETRMRLDGLQSTNRHVRARAIVMHGAAYVNEKTGVCGRSWGCPAVDPRALSSLVQALHDGSLLNFWKG